MRKFWIALILAFVVFNCGCAFLDVAAEQLGAPAEGEAPTVAYRAVKGAANLLPNWAGNALLGLTALLGWYKNSHNKKKLTTTITSVESAIEKLTKVKDEIIGLIASGEHQAALEKLMDGEQFRDAISESAKGYRIYEELRADVKKALAKRNAA
jgi:hypothetical protein